MKKLILVSAFVAALGTFASEGHAQQAKDAKVLVAYFSWSGNTKVIAEEIRSVTGGDLFEIKAQNPYPEEYQACTEQAKQEKESNARPALTGKVVNMADYDVVFVGYPNWWGTMPMPVLTFLESYDFAGKTVVPFCTHGGGGEQNCFSDFRKVFANTKATVGDGFLCSGGSVSSAKSRVASWIKSLGL